MPGQGQPKPRPYTADERAAMGNAIPTLGESTVDVYLNDRAYWRNVPRLHLELQAWWLPGP